MREEEGDEFSWCEGGAEPDGGQLTLCEEVDDDAARVGVARIEGGHKRLPKHVAQEVIPMVEAAAAALRLSRRTPIAATMSSRDKVPAAAFCRHIDIWAMTSGVMRVPFLK
jgi:hypothetical protein